MHTRTPRTLGAWLPDWSTQRARREASELKRRALVFTASDGRSERVVACSSEARRLGVHAGMRTPEAESLAGPNRLTRLPHDPEGDRRALTRLALECERFSPLFALEDAESADALLLDATGLALLWGTTREAGERRMACALQDWFGAKSLVSIVAIAPTPGLALAATRFAERLDAEAGARPLILNDHELVIDRLPIEALRVDADTIDKLRGLGIGTVGALRQLPRSSLPARFGPALIRRLDQLTGAAPEPLAAIRDSPPLSASWLYEAPVTNGETLTQTLGRLLESLAAEMYRRRRGALRVLITYELESPKETSARITLRMFRPTVSAKELIDLAEMHSSGLRLHSPVRAVHALVGATAPLYARQQALFENDAQEDPHESALLINRLANRLGFDRVSRVERRQSVDPQRAYALVPATDYPAKQFEMTEQQAARARRVPLAMRVRRGEPITVTTGADGAPASVRLRAEIRVVRYWGPQRVETGWWRGRGLRRDAYWIELADGARLWLWRDLKSRRWRLAGEFY